MRSTTRSKIVPSRRRQQRQRGNALVEFAVSSVLLLLLTIGVTDFARVFSVADAAVSAAEAGTTYGALSPAHYGDLEGMETAAKEDAGNVTGMTATASQTCACSIGGAPVDCPAACNTGLAQTYIKVTVTIPIVMSFSYDWMPAVNSMSGFSMVRVQ